MKARTGAAATVNVDFLIIGAQKSGSTSLFDYLCQHPSIVLPSVKEVPFFTRQELFEKGRVYLARYFDEEAEERKVGLAHVHMLSLSATAGRIRRHNPKMQMIAVLRNPIDRAYSAYWYARRNGREMLTFEDALRAEPDRRDTSLEARADFGYLSNGSYHELLQPFLNSFSREQLKILLTEDLARQPEDTICDLLTWLEVDRDASIDVSGRSNESSMPRSMWLQRTLMARNSSVKRLYHAFVPEGLRFRVHTRVVAPIIRQNLTPFRYPPMESDTRERLGEHFAEPNQRLSHLIGRDLSHWR